MDTLAQRLIAEGVMTQGQYDARVAQNRKGSTIKIDVNNLGEALVEVMMAQADLDARVTALEQAAGGGGGA